MAEIETVEFCCGDCKHYGKFTCDLWYEEDCKGTHGYGCEYFEYWRKTLVGNPNN
jgi:hypothetical protein